MKIIYEFDMNETDAEGNYLGYENEKDAKVYAQAAYMYRSLEELTQYLRNKQKYYTELSDDSYNTLDEIDTELKTILRDNGVDLDIF